MRLHVIALPHTSVTLDYVHCAYTQKVRNFVRMMRAKGHEVTLYSSGDRPDVAVDQWVQVLTHDEQVALYGDYDHREKFFQIEWEPTHKQWTTPNAKVISELGQRLGDKDVICLIGGNCQKLIADAFPNHLAVEFGIGYSGVFSKYKVFESQAWMHWVYGALRAEQGRFYDTVIPNAIDPDMFAGAKPPREDRYYLFVGRLIERKGWKIAVDAAQRAGVRLVLAGQTNGVDMSWLPDNVEHVGFIDAKQRAELMAGAEALLVPTTYIGPFEGVHAEAMMSGTPVITTDFGVFTETVTQGVHGFRCSTMGEFVEAIHLAPSLDRVRIQEDARARFSLEVVAEQYDDYFARLVDLHGEGWFSDRSTLSRFLV